MKSDDTLAAVCLFAVTGLALLFSACGVASAKSTTHTSNRRNVDGDIESVKKQLRKEYKRASKQVIARSYHRTLMAGVHAGNKAFIEDKVSEEFQDELMEYNDDLYDEYVA